MGNMMIKEMKLSASVLSYLFTLFGFMFLLPGYPILCGVFFSTLGIFKSFEFAREANDTVFSALLPVAKRDVVKGRYGFLCMIEICTLIFMTVSVILRMTILADAATYRNNALMNANFFALGAAFVIFGVFNVIFAGGFYRTAYKTGRPFLTHIIVAFFSIIVFETLHHIPGLEVLNSFGTDNVLLQIIMMIAGIAAWIMMTGISCSKACSAFEKVDL